MSETHKLAAMPTVRIHPARLEATLLGLSIGIQLIAVFLLVHAWVARTRTLDDGPWVSTKTTLARPVPGTMAFVEDRQALAGGRLNLHAWFGFHEVVSRREFPALRSLEFDFGLGANGYLVALFNRLSDGGWDAVRLSTHPHHPSALLEITPDGEFRKKQTLGLDPLQPGNRYTVRLDLEDGGVRIALDGRAIGAAPLDLAPSTPVGFRGGFHPAAVDDVRITLSDGSSVTESFDGRAYRLRAFFVASAAAVGLTLVLFGALRRRQWDARWPLGFHFVAASAALLAVSGMLALFVQFTAVRYATVGEEGKRVEEDFRKSSLEQTRARIRSDYAGPSNSGEYRVLLVGSSQTWGQGAAADDDVLAVVLEESLNRRFASLGSELRVECINAGTPGARAKTLLPVLNGEWLSLDAELVVINLSSNDMTTGPEFATQIREMVEAAQRSGAQVLLVKEAHSHSAVPADLERRHADLDAVAAATGVPIFNLHRYLTSRDDDGFLWWDMVHLTSLGQRWAVEALAWRIEPLLLEADASQAIAGVE